MNRGARLTELLKQPQFNPLPVRGAGRLDLRRVNGYLDTIPVNAVTRFEAALLADLRANHADLLTGIRDTKDLGDDLKAKLKAALDAFVKTFA